MNATRLLFLILFCFNLSHAQSESPGTSGVTAPPPPAAATIPTPVTPTPVPPAVNTLLNSVQPAPLPGAPIPGNPSIPGGVPANDPSALVKFEEYQSICRLNNFDNILNVSDSIKDQRIQLLQDKIKNDPALTKLKLRLLKEYYDQRKTKDAEKLVLEIRKVKASDFDINMADGILALLKGERKKAREIFVKASLDDPKSAEALKWLAEVYKQDENYYEATTAYQDLAKLTKDPQLEGLCEVLTLDNQYADAEPICLKGTNQTKNPIFYTYLGVAAREKQNLKEAQRYFSESLKVKETEMAHVCLGETLTMQKKMSEAESSYEAAVKLSPKSVRAHLGLAWTRFNSRNQEQALESFKSACGLDKRTILDLRKAMKVLLDEKSNLSIKYAQQVQRCSDI